MKIQNQRKREYHTFPPFYRQDSEVLILGSFPSVKSREVSFYYGHPQNRFWKMAAKVWGDKEPETVDEKKEFLAKNHIALWDVIASCEITGSSDTSITQAEVNDLPALLQETSVKKILVNGDTAYRLLKKHFDLNSLPTTIKMPSTSPANARFRLEDLVRVWSEAGKEERCDFEI